MCQLPSLFIISNRRIDKNKSVVQLLAVALSITAKGMIYSILVCDWTQAGSNITAIKVIPVNKSSVTALIKILFTGRE